MKPGKTIISAPSGEAGDGGPAIEDADDPAASGCEERSAVLQVAHHGSRLDHVLVDVVPEFSRSYLQQLVEAGAVALNGSPARRSSHKVRAGDALVVVAPPPPA